MKVTVVFDFPTVKNPDGVRATAIVDYLTQDTKVWAHEYEQHFPEFKCDVYVDDVVGDSNE